MGFGVNLPYCVERFGKAVAALESPVDGWQARLYEAVGQVIPTANVLPPELQKAFHSIIDRAYRLQSGERKDSLRSAIDGMPETEGRRLMDDIKTIYSELKAATKHSESDKGKQQTPHPFDSPDFFLTFEPEKNATPETD